MAATTVQQPWPSSRLAWYGVTMFGLTVMTLFGSNALIGLLVQPIKVDLGLTDTQVSLIVGFAAAAFNAIASLPISRLVDRMSRRLIIGVGLLVMGTGSALTGLANGFWQLFAARLFTGIGGAGNGPATYSILADYFPPAKLPKAIAFMNFGFTSGTGIALLLGGTLIAAVSGMGDITLPVIGAVRGWQLVFLVMAIPDLILGLLDADHGLRAAAARPGAGRGRKSSRRTNQRRARASVARAGGLRTHVPGTRVQFARHGDTGVGCGVLPTNVRLGTSTVRHHPGPRAAADRTFRSRVRRLAGRALGPPGSGRREPARRIGGRAGTHALCDRLRADAEPLSRARRRKPEFGADPDRRRPAERGAAGDRAERDARPGHGAVPVPVYHDRNRDRPDRGRAADRLRIPRRAEAAVFDRHDARACSRRWRHSCSGAV